MKRQAAILAIVFVIGLTIGHFGRPAKVVTSNETHKTAEKDSKSDKTTQDNTVTVVTETRKPDGTVTKVTETKKAVSSTQSNDIHTDLQTDKLHTTVTTYNTGWNVRLLGAMVLPSGKPVYGAGVDRTILGPLTVGAFGLLNGTVGVSIGLSL